MTPLGLDEEVVLEEHENSLLQRMNQMREESPEESFCDVSFDINGKEFHCHKVVLVSASPYFKTMFNGAYSESSACRKIALKEIESEALEEILTAIYTSRFHIHRGNAYFILRASHMLLLTNIFEATVAQIAGDTDIDYLIETCLFAQQVEQDDLYNKCIAAIASDLINLSKTHAFDTKITFDIFKGILSHAELIDDDKELFHIITKWYNSNKCTEDKVLNLLNSADLRSGCLSTPMMATFIVNGYSEIVSKNPVTPTPTSTETSTKKDGRGRKQHAKDVSFNIYSNTVDVETGAKGWGFWQWQSQSKNEFNESKVVYHVHSNAGYRKVKQIGNKLYCYEHNDRMNINRFYCLEDGEKKYLRLPHNTHTKFFDIEVMGNFIYLITELEQLWKFNCDTGSWIKVPLPERNTPRSPSPSEFSRITTFYLPSSSSSSSSNNRRSRAENPLWDRQTPRSPSPSELSRIHNYPMQNLLRSSSSSNLNNKRTLSEDFTLSPKLASNERNLYIVGLEDWDVIKIVPNQPRMTTRMGYGCLHKAANPAVCCYDGKLVVCGSNYDGNLHKTVSLYDMTADKWNRLKDMNTGRANHSISYHNGFLYAIENKHMVPNEKYDTKRREWINFPSVPEQITMIQNGKRVDVATGDIFNFAINF